MKIKAKNGMIIVPQDVVESIVHRSGVLRLLDEAVSKIVLPKDEKSILESEVGMGRIVGKTIYIRTPQIRLNEATYFATRAGKDRPSRISLLGEGIPSSIITIIARPIKKLREVDRDSDEIVYVLLSAWIGGLAAKEPWSSTIKSAKELDKCLGYWQNHAFVYNPMSMYEPFVSTLNEVLGERNCDYRDNKSE